MARALTDEEIYIRYECWEAFNMCNEKLTYKEKIRFISNEYGLSESIITSFRQKYIFAKKYLRRSKIDSIKNKHFYEMADLYFKETKGFSHSQIRNWFLQKQFDTGIIDSLNRLIGGVNYIQAINKLKKEKGIEVDESEEITFNEVVIRKSAENIAANPAFVEPIAAVSTPGPMIKNTQELEITVSKDIHVLISNTVDTTKIIKIIDLLRSL